MLFDVAVLAGMLGVAHPGGEGEGGRQIVVEDAVRDRHGRAGAVELEHLVGLVALVGDERLGPLGAQARARQQVDRRRGGSAQFSLRFHAVGVPVATFADVPGSKEKW